MKYTALFILFVFIHIVSCGPTAVAEKNLILDDHWNYDDSLVLDVNIDDEDAKYDLLVEVDHEESFSYQNLYLLIKTVFPDGKNVEAPLSLELSNKKGKWQSKCSGSACSLQFFLQENFSFEASGSYQFSISQYSRDAELEGVNEIKLMLMKAGE